MAEKFDTWYAEISKKNRINPNPDDFRHFYDYRKAHKAGVTLDESGHLPSKYKDDLHPNRFIQTEDGWYDTKYENPSSQDEKLFYDILRDEKLNENLIQ